MKLLANDTESPEYVEMHKMLFNPFGIYDGELDSIIRGAFNSSIEKADNFFTEQVLIQFCLIGFIFLLWECKKNHFIIYIIRAQKIQNCLTEIDAESANIG